MLLFLNTKGCFSLIFLLHVAISKRVSVPLLCVFLHISSHISKACAEPFAHSFGSLLPIPQTTKTRVYRLWLYNDISFIWICSIFHVLLLLLTRRKRCNIEVSGKRNRFGEHLTWLRHLKCKCHIMPTLGTCSCCHFESFFFFFSKAMSDCYWGFATTNIWNNARGSKLLFASHFCF